MKPTFRRFNTLREKDVKFDFHIHTDQTDGISTPEEIVQKAKYLNLEAIAFTEHVTHESDWFPDFKKKIKSLDSDDLKIYVGIETKPLDFNGTLDAMEYMLNSDIVIGSVHRYPLYEGGLIPFYNLKMIGQTKAADIEFNAALGMLKNSKIDVLGHPFGVYSLFYKDVPENYLRALFKESLKRKIAIEINTKYFIETKKLFRLLKEVNPYVSIGSDAHKKEDICRSFHIIKENLK